MNGFQKMVTSTIINLMFSGQPAVLVKVADGVKNVEDLDPKGDETAVKVNIICP